MVTFTDKLKGLLFLEFNKDQAAAVFGVPELESVPGDLYIPINPEFLIKEINEANPLSQLPLAEFIIGMAYCLGADPNFKYGDSYVLILKGFAPAPGMIKHKAAELVKQGKRSEVFILLAGLYEAAGDEEIETALLTLREELALKDIAYGDNVLHLADTAIANGNNHGRLIKGSILRLLGKIGEALSFFRDYVANGGEETPELAEVMEGLDRTDTLDSGYALVHDKPAEALETLLPLYKSESSNPRYLYHLALAYRNLGNHDKAIYYLEEGRLLDNAYLDILNELGINYAMLDDQRTAEAYFRKVYEASGDIAPLTNLIICLFDQGKAEEGRQLFEIAQKKLPGDEILAEIKKIYLKQ